MCRIGLTEEPQGPRVTLQQCLTAGHRIFSTWLFSSVPLSAWVSLLTEEHSGSRSQLTVDGDVSTSVKVTLSSIG